MRPPPNQQSIQVENKKGITIAWMEFFSELFSAVRSLQVLSIKSIATADSPYSQLSADSILICDATAGNMTINLLPASSWTGRRLTFKKINSGHTVTIIPNGSETIDNAANYTLTAHYSSVDMVAKDGKVWVI